MAQIDVLSACCGFIAWALPSLLFHWWARACVKPKPGQSGGTLLKNFFVAEMLKLLLTAGLITLFIKYLPIKALLFLGGFVIALFVGQISGNILLCRASKDKNSGL